MGKIIVLGAGMVGSAIAGDLSKDHETHLTDFNPVVLDKAKAKYPSLTTAVLDVADGEALKSALGGFDLVVCAVPGFLGFNTLKGILEAKKNVVDISFFPEDALSLHELAKEQGVTAIVDCGVAPGMDNLILGRYNEVMELTDFECLVGGLPKVKKWPFCYKAPFSPIDVIEEYTRPARYVENGVEIVREALTDCEFVEFDRVGTLESFNSDGLRSIIHTMSHIPNMKEKTLRYPGHVEYIKVLKSSGFFSTDPVEVNGMSISVLDFTSKILFDAWKLEEGDEELTVMRVTVKGKNKEGKVVEVVYNLYDEYCGETGISSMSRTTGYTATAATNMFLAGLFSEKGVFPPELVGKYAPCFDYIIQYLRDRGVNYHKSTQVLEA